MKRILLLVALATTILTSYSQALDYNDLGLLFSKDNTNGTARFNAMSGAFGALGSDLSSTDINPAGAAVARDSKFSVTLSNRNANLDVNYYGNTNNLQDEYFNISQAGGIFVFDIDNSNSSWNRFAFTFNYKMKADFDNLYSGRGNSNFLFYDQHIGDTNSPVNIFDGSIEQSFSNETRGLNSVFNIGISAVHDNKLFVGASLKFHNLEFRERSFLTEMNDDVNGNILEVEDFRERFIEGNGFSFNLGFIYKLNKFIRLGASYESPTWYQEVIEERAVSLTMFDVNNLGITGVEDRFFEGPYSLRFTTPSRLTASGALVFGKQGLISVDYTYKDFQNFKYREVDQELQDANQFFRTDFRATQKLSVGTEWRFARVSLRGGYSYELDPNLVVGGNTNKDNIRAFSAGLGYNFGNTKIDLSYQQSENRQFYSLYNTGDINIDNNISVVAATVTFSL
ncbi:OmpP1/FadL family transporter [Tenacibaculum sp. 190524A05c]|uniref:OmpP1/FadL family transporter n=1 Tax=Tenacibaculum platacis TaxID=3137852 RepID=UPI0031FB3A56